MKGILYEIKKQNYLLIFIIEIIGIICTCISSSCYTDEKGKTYTVLGMIFNTDGIDMSNYISLNQIEVWRCGFGTWSYILLPLFVGLGYIYVISEERKNGMLCSILIRESRMQYCISKMVSCMITSGFLILLGYMIYGLIVMLVFPNLTDYSINDVIYYMELTGIDSIVMYILKRLSLVFLYGICLGVYSFIVAIFFTDKYILICLPMMISYIHYSFINKISIQMMQMENWSGLEFIQVFQIKNVLDATSFIKQMFTLLFVLIFYLLFLLIFFRSIKNMERGLK